MLPQEIIAKKRDKQRLLDDEIRAFIKAVSKDELADSQIGAFTMATLLNGMDRDETVSLTKAMRDSGEILNWDDLDGPIIDKHSTGGVGDNVSLILAPMVAACGGYCPMISGRGLGHTGGTLDKFDAIAGYDTQPNSDLFRNVTKQVGCAIIGQTADLAPADKKIYAIRDVTATVESVPLITASILSKKLAAGLDGLALDVKVGSGAFMSDLAKARDLATSLVEVANGAGVKTTALITDMDHPLSSSAGNSVEVQSAIDLLTGNSKDRRLKQICIELTAEMLVSGGLVASIDEGKIAAESALSSGRAAEKFGQMVSGLGGPIDLIENASNYLKKAKYHLVVESQDDALKSQLGFDTKQIGMAVVELGGGRMRPTDKIDYSVGITNIAGRDWDGNSPICEIWARDSETAERAKYRILGATRKQTTDNPPILEKIS